MTYILGFRQPGLNAIVSDARVTRSGTDPDRHDENTAVKTGLLFPGCVFGRAGNDYRSRQFILAFRGIIEGTRDSLAGFWRRFEEFVDWYQFAQGDSDYFELLLSTRAFGEPRLFLLDSERGLESVENEHDCYLVTTRKGKSDLHSRVTRSFAPWLQGVQAHLLAEMPQYERVALATTPFCLCLWLSELSLSFERADLEERQKIGGAFHFIYQDRETDHGQGPAVYILLSQGSDQTIYPFLFRVVRIPGGLYVNEQAPPGQQIVAPDGQEVQSLEYALLNTIGRPDIAVDGSGMIPPELEQRLQQEIRQEVDSVPYFHFCGFGFTDPRFRNSYHFQVSRNGKRGDIFGADGRLAPVHRDYAERAFSQIAPPGPQR